MSTKQKTKVAIIGSGNIGSDLMMKIIHHSEALTLAAMIGVDPQSDGLARARELGVTTSHEGIDGLMAMADFADIRLVFDATSAGAHAKHQQKLHGHDVVLIDLTPAAIGPYVVPVVNLDEHLGQRNLNMVTCGGQATIPVVAAVSAVTPVLYAEIVASIASDSAGPGTRANIDEFTETTSAALQTVGGAQQGKAIIILNPAEPPLLMRDTVYCLTHSADEAAIEASILAQVAKVQAYVPGYRLKQAVQFESISVDQAQHYPYLNGRAGVKVSVFLEVEGAADYLPAYAGNLDIMTSAALACAERVVNSKGGQNAA